jgi:ComF family protein
MYVKTPRILQALSGPVVDVVLPQLCWAGGAGDVTLGLSAGARDQIATLAAQPFCRYCGLSVGPHETHDQKNPCGRCGRREVGVDRIARVGTFSEPLVTLVHRLKFARSWEVAQVLAPFLYQAVLRVAEETHTPVDLLVPVPLHWSRQARRGFNQANEIARETAALSRWPVAPALWRKRRTAEQALTDSVTTRRENLRGAFACRRCASKQVAHKHVWLIDDVSTTGATLHAAAGMLRQLPRDQRPASINAAVVCVTDHRAPEVISSAVA